jgi:hypothetical protein
VCLIRWEEDELEVKGEVDRLHDVFDEYVFLEPLASNTISHKQ